MFRSFQKKCALLAGLAIAAVCGCSHQALPEPPAWSSELNSELQALGYRNWIIVAESSFPVHSRRGVRTVVVDTETPEMVDYIVDYFDRSENVKPSFSTAHELAYVENDRAPGIDDFRARLKKALHGHDVRKMDHRALSLLAQSDSKKFAVLVIKTKTALPYTNVFIELDSGYWDRESEDQLRAEMKAQRKDASAEKTQP